MLSLKGFSYRCAQASVRYVETLRLPNSRFRLPALKKLLHGVILSCSLRLSLAMSR